jgi:hypothetical protein
MTRRAAIAFVRRHGVVLEGAHGPVPTLAEAVAGEQLRGSWWSHRKGRDIFRLTRAVRDSDEVLVCRLVAPSAWWTSRLVPLATRRQAREPTEPEARIVLGAPSPIVRKRRSRRV